MLTGARGVRQRRRSAGVLAFLVLLPVVFAHADVSHSASTTGADVRVALSGGDAAAVESPFTYTLEVGNDGPEDATEVTVVDTLPADVTVTRFDTGCASEDGTVRCGLSELASGEEVSFEVVVTPSAAAEGTTLTNSVEATALEPDPDSTNNGSTMETPVLPEGSADLFVYAAGGGGKDVLLGGAGKDTFLARDGVRDAGNGGPGSDRARVDKTDVLKSIEKRF